MLPQITVFTGLIVTQEHIILPRLFPRIRIRTVQGDISPLVIKLANIALTANRTRQPHYITPPKDNCPSFF
jgi:hypothetical protein